MDKTNEKRWTLRIMYLSDSGESLAPSQRKSCVEGLLYYVEPRKIPGDGGRLKLFKAPISIAIVV